MLSCCGTLFRHKGARALMKHNENLPTQSWKVSLTALGRFAPFVPFVPFAKKLLKFFRTLAIRRVEETGSKTLDQIKDMLSKPVAG